MNPRPRAVYAACVVYLAGGIVAGTLVDSPDAAFDLAWRYLALPLGAPAHGPTRRPLSLDARLTAAGRAVAPFPALREKSGQTEDAEEITVVVERQLVLVTHRRKKYRCACNGCVETNPGPAAGDAARRARPAIRAGVRGGGGNRQVPRPPAESRFPSPGFLTAGSGRRYHT